jgi:lipid-binding SYLF domain-containing protein
MSARIVRVWSIILIAGLASLSRVTNAGFQTPGGNGGSANMLENAGKVMQGILNAPDTIPQSVLDRADCIVILPSVSSDGRGVMTCRGGKDFKGPWGAPTMMALERGSAVMQLGGNATDFVLLLMSPRSAENILKNKVKIGANASTAAAPVGHAASAATDATLRADILSYSRARGLFAGVSLEGCTLQPDNEANRDLYGKEVSASDIVFNKAVPVPDKAKTLLAVLNKASR